MDNFVIYMIKVIVCMTLAYVPYHFLMRRSSFFTANRLYLLAAILLSLIIPLLKLSANQIPVSIAGPLLSELPLAANSTFIAITAQFSSSNSGIEWNMMLPLVYLGITLLLVLKFSTSLLKLYMAYRSSEIIRQNKMIVLVSEKQHLPFSFFRFVFLSRSDFENKNNHLILIHEHAHLRCLHSFDLLLLELLQLLFWINPMIIVYRNAIRLQHEYMVDKIVLQETNDYTGYLYSLVQVVSNGVFTRMGNGFYCSTLKKRIQMIGNKTSRKITTIRYLIILPLILFIVLAFTQPEVKKFFTILVPLQIIQTEPADVPSIVPIDESKARYDVGYGDRIHPIYKIKMFHHGADWTAPTGTEVYAAADGTIEKLESNEGGYGKEIVIHHNKKLSTRYAHLSAFTVKLHEEVKKGQVIGYVGSSGRSTAPHLHYEVLINGQDVDPGKYFKLAAKKEHGVTFD